MSGVAMDTWRCEYCDHLITMPCQRPECVEAKKAHAMTRREATEYFGEGGTYDHLDELPKDEEAEVVE